jgi:hypothetical protein
MEAVGLLGEIVAFAQEVSCKPVIGEANVRREHCEFLESKLQEAISSNAASRRYLDNFAPLLIKACDRGLVSRHWQNEDAAVKWESLIGHLMPLVRADGAAALSSLRDDQPDRPTR